MPATTNPRPFPAERVRGSRAEGERSEKTGSGLEGDSAVIPAFEDITVKGCPHLRHLTVVLGATACVDFRTVRQWGHEIRVAIIVISPFVGVWVRRKFRHLHLR